MVKLDEMDDLNKQLEEIYQIFIPALLIYKNMKLVVMLISGILRETIFQIATEYWRG